MRCMGEHIDGLHGHYFIFGIKKSQVTGLRGRVTADVHNARGRGFQYDIHNVGVHTGARRVGNDDVGRAMLPDKFIVKNVFHVSGEERCIVNFIDL